MCYSPWASGKVGGCPGAERNPSPTTSLDSMMMRNAFRDIESGSFGNKTVAGDASTGGISVGTLSDVLVEPYVQERYLGIAEQIAQGAFIG